MRSSQMALLVTGSPSQVPQLYEPRARSSRCEASANWCSRLESSSSASSSSAFLMSLVSFAWLRRLGDKRIGGDVAHDAGDAAVVRPRADRPEVAEVAIGERYAVTDIPLIRARGHHAIEIELVGPCRYLRHEAPQTSRRAGPRHLRGFPAGRAARRCGYPRSAHALRCRFPKMPIFDVSSAS